jgi:hypothetical protein
MEEQNVDTGTYFSECFDYLNLILQRKKEKCSLEVKQVQNADKHKKFFLR